MNAALEFHDSEVALVAGADHTLKIQFSAAYIHRSSGRPGIDAGAGYIQPAELVFSAASWSELSDDYAGDLSSGLLLINGTGYSLVPLPFSAVGQISAELVFVSGAVLSISASSIRCQHTGEPRFVENYPGKF